MAVVFIPVQLRELTGGQSQIDTPGRTVREVVESLDRQFPGFKDRICKDGELSPSLQVSIDDQFSGLGLYARLQADSELHFLPAIGGG